MIPRIIHQLWISPTGGRDIPGATQDQCHLWASLNSTFIYKLWALDSVRDLCTAIGREDVKESIDLSRFPAMKSDIARLIIMKTFGGFWADLKLRPVSTIPEQFLSFNAIFSPSHSAGSDFKWDDINSHFMGSSPGHSVIEQALKLVQHNISLRRGISVYGVSGPINLQIAIKETIKREGASPKIKILSKDDVWGKLFENGAETYNGNNMHWSVRQKTEPMYTDSPGLPWE